MLFKQSCKELWFVKECRNHTFKVNFLCQKLMESFQKKNLFKNMNLGDYFLTNWRSPYSQNTMVSFEYTDFWPKTLLLGTTILKIPQPN